MNRNAQILVRLVAYAAGGLIASVAASVLASGVDMYFGVPVQSAWFFTYFGTDVQTAWFLGLGAMAGITSGIGLDLARGAPRPVERRRLALWPWLAAAGIGIVGDVLLALPSRSSSAAVIGLVAFLALATVNGLAVGSDARPGAFGRSLVALALSLVAGIAFAAVAGAVVSAVVILTHHPCPPHAYCMEPPPLQAFLVSAFLGLAALALPAALWLGVASWLALGLGLTLQRHTWQEA